MFVGRSPSTLTVEKKSPQMREVRFQTVKILTEGQLGSIAFKSPAQQRLLQVLEAADAGPRSAPQADVAHGLTGGAALCRRQVDLTAGTHTHLVHASFLGGGAGRRCIDPERETSELDGAGVQKYLLGQADTFSLLCQRKLTKLPLSFPPAHLSFRGLQLDVLSTSDLQ